MSTTSLKINPITEVYWLKEDLVELQNASSIEQMLPLAMKVLNKMPQGNINQVCGPIGSGGHVLTLGQEKGIVENLKSFNKAINSLQKKDYVVFDQMPFEEPIQRLKKQGLDPKKIITDFYYPIFESGLIKTFHFMKGWQNSDGANLEMEKIIFLNNERKMNLVIRMFEIDF